jgi:hypothetical protein
MDPSSSVIAWLFGKATIAKVTMAIAAFAGAVLSLMFLKGLSRPQMYAAVAIGFFSSLFCTPLVMHVAGLPDSPKLGYGIAYVIGLMAMNLIPLLKKAFAKKIGVST